MAQTAALVLDDVLCRGAPIESARPIDEGMALYHTLKAHYRLALLTLYPHRDAVEAFIAANGLRDHVVLLSGSRLDEDLRTLRLQAHDVRLYIDADPQSCAVALSAGIAVLHFAQPAYMRPEWRPDYVAKPRPWDSIEEEVRRQQRLRAEQSPVES